MQDPPDLPDVLRAIARFLEEEARPNLADPQRSFRALIAAHLCTTAAREVEHDEAQTSAELSRLNLLFADDPAPHPPTREAMRARIDELTDRLVTKIRAGQTTDGERSHIARHVRDTLREKLQVNSPTFDLSRDIEVEPMKKPTEKETSK